MKFAYFGHHKCASKFITEFLRSLCQEAGLSVSAYSMTNNLPYGYHEKWKYRRQWKRVAKKIRAFDCDLLIHRNADGAVQDLLEGREFRGFHVIRDPRDILVSAYFSHKYSHKLLAPWLEDQRRNLERIDDVEEGLLYDLEMFTSVYLRKMQSWDYNDDRMYETRFERITTDPKAEWDAILNFTGLPFDRDWFHARLEAASFERLSSRKKGEEDQQSHFRKGVAGDWRNHFTDRVKDAFKKDFGQMLIDLGYETDMNW